jgi:hypothetical protein
MPSNADAKRSVKRPRTVIRYLLVATMVLLHRHDRRTLGELSSPSARLTQGEIPRAGTDPPPIGM